MFVAVTDDSEIQAFGGNPLGNLVGYIVIGVLLSAMIFLIFGSFYYFFKHTKYVMNVGHFYSPIGRRQL